MRTPGHDAPGPSRPLARLAPRSDAVSGRPRGAHFEGPELLCLRRHLLRTRLARTLGVTTPMAAAWLLTARYNVDPDGAVWHKQTQTWLGGYWLSGAGYLLATVWAEATKPRPAPRGQGSAAVLEVRRLQDYLDPIVAWSLLACLATAAGTGLGLWLWAPAIDVDEGVVPVVGAFVVAGAGLGAAVLARDLGLAPGTVARAYAELEAGGWVHAQGRRGTRVAPRRELPRLEEMSAAAQRLAELAGEAGLGPAEAHQLLDIALARRDRDA